MLYEKELQEIESLRNDLIEKQKDLIYKILSENGGSISINLDEDNEPDENNNPDNVCTNIYTFNGCELCDIHEVSILNNEFKIKGRDIECGALFFGESYPDNYSDILTFITQMIDYNNKQ